MRDLLEALKTLDKYGLMPAKRGGGLRATKAELAAQLDRPVGRGKHTVLTDEQRKEAKVMFVAGASKRSIAKHFGVAESTIYRFIPAKGRRGTKRPK